MKRNRQEGRKEIEGIIIINRETDDKLLTKSDQKNTNNKLLAENETAMKDKSEGSRRQSKVKSAEST